ncbi:hypothetical protein [Vibrio sp. SCSIO 43137]|uniref:hypothetical protein n=1 Tax=Vibrio sp. SCSIO 43137 TaxID=3021011 RepID=UPI002308076B|nr:hypothetical protein [Vibrio sp. SCSIO 43137]WCE31104.1 hypothetical protein PK654_07520 [Vibrio sp. SCSIO 43137]
MANPTIGTIICPMCGDVADVRKDKNGKLYYSGKAGLISPKSADGQSWLKAHANLEGVEPEPAHEEPIATNIEREETAKSGGLFSGLLDDVFGGADECIA